MKINLYPIHAEPESSDFLQGAAAAAEQIRSAAIPGEKGVYWTETKDGKAQIDFYHGSAGIISFFLQMAKVSGDPSYLQDARDGGDYILAELIRTDYEYPIQSAFAPFHTYMDNSASFYTGGFAGVAFSLIELTKATGDTRYVEAARILTKNIAASAKSDAAGCHWSGFSGATHDAGTVNYLLYAGRYFHTDEWLDTALKGGRTIMSTGEACGQDRVIFKGFSNPLLNPDRSELIYPNFAYGTAGMCYALAALHEASGDRDFLQAAENGARYLMSIASPVNGGKLIPHHVPFDAEDGLYYVSFCHGPAGSGRLFVLLHRLTGKKVYQDFYEDLGRGIIGIGAPEYHSAGYWNCHSQCCGTAGFLNYFLGLYLESGNDEYLGYARRSGKTLLGSAWYNGDKAVWYQAFSRKNPGAVASVLGYSEGCAGIGAALLQLYGALEHRFKTIRLPDDPFRAEV